MTGVGGATEKACLIGHAPGPDFFRHFSFGACVSCGKTSRVNVDRIVGSVSATAGIVETRTIIGLLDWVTGRQCSTGGTGFFKGGFVYGDRLFCQLRK